MKNNVIVGTSLTLMFAISPPKDGNFPEGFWARMESQNIGQTYGDPGWIKKIADKKDNLDRDDHSEFFVPVLLGKYSDVSNTYFNSSDYNQLLFGENPTGSLTEYFDEVSYGNISVDGIVEGWYQSNLNQSQAVANTREFVAEIASLADPDIDYSQYDNDGPDNIPNSGDDDGYVDGLAVIYPGCMTGSDNIWAHQSSLSSYEYTTNDPSQNGGNIIVSSYMVSPELPGQSTCITSEINPIGLFAHEFGHILGLPDLYDRDGGSEGLGEWCIMASGNYLGYWGDSPSHMSAWCKMQMGWLDPQVMLNSSNSVELEQVVTSNTAIKVWEDDYYWSRYFLIENRQAVGFDSEINAPGLLVYHVDENRGWGNNGWSFGSVNDDELNKMVDLESADGENDLDNEYNRGDSGDPFPGSTENRTFDNYSTPSSTRNNGMETGIAIANISDPGTVMTFELDSRSQYGYAIAYDENGIAPTTFGIGTEDQWSGVLFTPEESGFITEVDFGIIYDGWWDNDVMEWTVYVYDSFDGDSPGNLMATVNGSSDKSDWTTVSIDSVPVQAQQDFFVAVKFINNTYAFCFDNTGTLSGRSYLSGDGVNYDNMLSSYGDANIRAKISTDAYVDIANEDNVLPLDLQLHPNYPNPFNPSTMISFTINNNIKVLLEIYDIKGRKIETLINSELRAGQHNIAWNGAQYSSGIYFVNLKTANFDRKQKITLLK